MIGELKKQLVYDAENGQGTHYLIKCGEQEARLEEILDTLKEYYKSIDKDEKKMIRDLCLMLANGKFPEPGTPEAKAQLLRFTIGYLLGKFTSNTDLTISAENIKLSRKDVDDT